MDVPLTSFYALFPIKVLLKVLRIKTHTLLSNHADLSIPKLLQEEIQSQDRGISNPIVYEIKINPYHDTQIRILSVSDKNKYKTIFYLIFNSFMTLLERLPKKLNKLIDKCRPKKTKPSQNSPSKKISCLFKNKTYYDFLYRLLISKVLNTQFKTHKNLTSYLLSEKLSKIPTYAFPSFVHIALTKKCNLKCIMCPYHSKTSRETHIDGYFEKSIDTSYSSETLEKALIECGEHRASVGFGQYDEPFLYKDFPKFAILAKNKGCKVYITTNGTLLKENIALELCKANIDHISFSLDAATEQTYKEIRMGKFSIPINNLKTLVKVRNSINSKTIIRACMVRQEKNKNEKDTFYNLMDEIGVDIVSFYNESVWINDKWEFPNLNFEPNKPKNGDRYTCTQLFEHMSIYPGGSVSMCCLSTLYKGYREDIPELGNLNSNTLKEIWNAKGYKMLRKEAFQGEFTNSICNDCVIWCNSDTKTSLNDRNHTVSQNPYETFIKMR